MKNSISLLLLAIPTAVGAQQLEWIHRNFRLNYWIDPSSITRFGDNYFVEMMTQGVCLTQPTDKTKSPIKYWITREEINCNTNKTRSVSTRTFDAKGNILETQAIKSEFEEAINLGIAKIVGRVCKSQAITNGLVNDTQPAELIPFSNECYIYGRNRVNNSSIERVISEGYVDLSRTYTEYGITYAWIRRVYESSQRNPNGKDFSRAEERYAFKCKSREMAATETLKIDSNSNIIESWKAYSQSNLNWLSIRPGTSPDYLLDLVCESTKHKKDISIPPQSNINIKPTIQSTGSGFKISQNLFVTNEHVINQCSKIIIQGKEATIVNSDNQTDLALLSVKGVDASVAKINKSNARVGDDISVAGFPLNGILSGFNFARGNISSLSGLGGNTQLLQITAPIQPGNSGGPLLDSNGDVIGVVVSKLSWRALSITGDIPQNVNFSINVNSLASFLHANNVNYQSTNSIASRSMISADVAEKAKRFTVLVECHK